MGYTGLSSKGSILVPPLPRNRGQNREQPPSLWLNCSSNQGHLFFVEHSNFPQLWPLRTYKELACALASVAVDLAQPIVHVVE